MLAVARRMLCTQTRRQTERSPSHGESLADGLQSIPIGNEDGHFRTLEQALVLVLLLGLVLGLDGLLTAAGLLRWTLVNRFSAKKALGDNGLVPVLFNA